MTSTSADSALPQNGVSPKEHQLQADFFSKLASFETLILNQQHPRYKLPTDEIEKVASALQRASVDSAEPSKPSANSNSNQTTRADQIPPAPVQQDAASVSRYASFPQPLLAPKAVHARSSPSSFDPVLLTKSNDLIRAELNLKRLRIERALHDLLPDSRQDPKKDRELGLWLGAISFDAAKVLDSSRALVEPLSGFRPSKATGVSSSSSYVDENPNYYNKGNSWSPPAGETQTREFQIPPSTQQRDQSDSLNLKATSTAREPGVDGQGPKNDPYPHADMGKSTSSQPQPQSLRNIPQTSEPIQQASRDIESLREESYSPPPPEATDDYEPPQPEQFSVSAGDAAPTHSRQMSKPAHIPRQRSRESESYSPPPPQPQPPHISSSAANDWQQILSNDRRGHPSNQGNAQISQAKSDRKKGKNIKSREARNTADHANSTPRKVSDNHLTPNSRKRRRDFDESDDIPRQAPSHQSTVQSQYRSSPSQDLHIKREPVSPFPPSNEPPRRVVVGQDGGLHLEVLTPRLPALTWMDEPNHSDGSADARQPSAQYDPRYPALDPTVFNSSGGPRTFHGQRQLHDEENLRRLATVRHASGPYTRDQPSPTYNSYSDDEPLTAESVSKMMSNLPELQYRRNLAEQRKRFPALGRASGRENPLPDYSAAQTPHLPPPPPAPARPAFTPIPTRRFLRDEYGNEYIATLARPEMYQPSLGGYESLYQWQNHGPAPNYAHNQLAGQTLVEPRRRIAREPQVVNIEDDNEDYPSMPPPPPAAAARMVSRRRPVESRDDAALTQLPQYHSQPAIRAASLQPQAPPNAQPSRSVSHQRPAWSSRNVADSGRERALSAMPSAGDYDDSIHNGLEWRRL